jgi:hypothetical protein
MKLIRLYTEGSGVFDNFFNEDLIIEKQSKIALDMVSAEIASPFLDINSENDLITYKLGEDEYVATFTQGRYDNTNINDLFTGTTTNLNKSLPYENQLIGLQWRLSEIDKKTNLQLQYGKEFLPLINGKASNEQYFQCDIINDPPLKYFQRTAGVVASLDSYYTVNTANCKGSNTLRCDVVSLGLLNKGLIIGYVENAILPNTPFIELTSIKYGIQLVNDGTRYNYILDGTETPSTNNYVPQQGDYLDLQSFDGKMKYIVYRGDTEQPENIFETSYDHTTNLYPVIIFIGTNEIGSVQYFGDSYNYGSFKNKKYSRQSLGDIPEAYIIPTKREINLSVSVATALGYDDNIYESQINGVSVSEENTNFIADNNLTLVDYSESYYIEMLNINLDSYDGFTKQRKNILDNIAQISLVNERLLYTANYPKFLNINNSQDMSLRRIKARIVKEDGSLALIKGIAIISILIKSPNES